MKTNETGRSMVEMLGVLAIIGVLSVAGIAGYSMAMKKHTANEAASAISMGVVLARTANGGDGLDSTHTSATFSSLNFAPPTSSGLSNSTEIEYVANQTYYKVNAKKASSGAVDCTTLLQVAPADTGAAAKTGYYVASCS